MLWGCLSGWNRSGSLSTLGLQRQSPDTQGELKMPVRGRLVLECPVLDHPVLDCPILDCPILDHSGTTHHGRSRPGPSHPRVSHAGPSQWDRPGLPLC